MKLPVNTPNETRLLIAALALMLASGLAIAVDSIPAAIQSEPTVLGVTLTYASTASTTSASTTSASTTLYSCVDTDNGDNPAVKGTVTVTNSSIGLTNLYTDSCAASSTVSEYVCAGATTTSTAGYAALEETCRDGYCQDGACVTPTYTVSFSPSSTVPANSLAEGKGALLAAFTLSVNGTAAAALNSIVLSVEAENASFAFPALLIGPGKPIYGSATPIKTAKKTMRAYKIIFSKLNTALPKNSATGFKITATVTKNSRLSPAQLPLLQIFLPRDSISWQNTVTRQPSNEVPGLPWTSAKLIVR